MEVRLRERIGILMLGLAIGSAAYFAWNDFWTDAIFRVVRDNEDYDPETYKTFVGHWRVRLVGIIFAAGSFGITVSLLLHWRGRGPHAPQPNVSPHPIGHLGNHVVSDVHLEIETAAQSVRMAALTLSGNRSTAEVLRQSAVNLKGVCERIRVRVCERLEDLQKSPQLSQRDRDVVAQVTDTAASVRVVEEKLDSIFEGKNLRKASEKNEVQAAIRALGKDLEEKVQRMHRLLQQVDDQDKPESET